MTSPYPYWNGVSNRTGPLITPLTGTEDAAYEPNAVVLTPGSSYGMLFKSEAGEPVYGDDCAKWATSSDGVTWARGNSDNPVLTGLHDGSWQDSYLQPLGLINDGTTLHAYWICDNAAKTLIQPGYASSTNGTSWSNRSINPLLAPGDFSNWPSAVTYISVSDVVVQAGVYQFFGCAGVLGTGPLYLFTSKGASWTDCKSILAPTLILSPGAIEYGETERLLSEPCVFQWNGKYVLTCTTNMSATNTGAVLQTHWATSPDLLTWTKQQRFPWLIGQGAAGGPDAGAFYTPHILKVADGVNLTPSQESGSVMRIYWSGEPGTDLSPPAWTFTGTLPFALPLFAY